MQFLYQVECGADGEDARRLFWRRLNAPPEVLEFARQLAERCLEHREEIDEHIARAAANWRLERMARIDLCILRLGVCELRWFPETPESVVIDEAIEIARRYSDEGAPAFINGILDRVARELRVRSNQK